MKRRLAKGRGFTLLEVVVSLTLLSFGLLAVANGLAYIIRMTNQGRMLNEVASLATSQLQQLRIEGCLSNGSRVEGPFLVQWIGSPVPGGRMVTIAIERVSAPGQHVDSLTWFQGCRLNDA